MMRQTLSLRPKRIRPVIRDHAPSFFQMHVYDNELHRLEVERAEMAKRISVIDKRVQVVHRELQKLDRTLRKRVINLRTNIEL